MESFNEMAARQVAEARARAAAARLTLTPEEEVKVDQLLVVVEQALQAWRDSHMAHPATNFGTCEYDSTYQDFDGTWATMRCGSQATQQVLIVADHDTRATMIMDVCEWHAAVLAHDIAAENAEVAQAWKEWDADH
jgi:hypothetical protein